MGLRRTGMSRKKELKRAALLRRTPLARGKALAARSVAAARPVDTGPSVVLRRLVAERAGYCCERCGRFLHDGDAWTRVHSFHHRLPRGRGGGNTAANLVLVCGSGVTGCHGQIESQRTAAYDTGWLVETGIDPAAKPLLIHELGHVFLTADGDYQEVR